MGLKSLFLRPWANQVSKQIVQWSTNALKEQENIFTQIIRRGCDTQFGIDHDFANIKSYEDFKQRVPVQDYEGLKTYFDRVVAGESNVLWPGRPRYFAKTSGTTSGVKYIPITSDSLPNHFGSAKNALFNYFGQTGKGKWLDGKIIFLSGSPSLDDTNGVPTGRLSGISNHLVPDWVKRSQMPSYETNCIDAWEEKLDKIVEETLHQKMTLISGIPPWVQMYYERLLEASGKSTIKEIFPDFSMFVYGGVNYEPYRAKLEELVGGQVDSVEIYPASEGFLAFQDIPGERGMFLNVASGLFFEFIPVNELGNEHPTRLRLHDVQCGVNYLLILNTNAGLWGYNIGDTVEFVSTNPYRIIVTGRVKHYISAFGEHVIGKEVDEAMQLTCKALDTRVVEFTVAPQVTPSEGGLPYHEWWVEFDEIPADLDRFAQFLDREMVKQNIYYDDLIQGSVLKPLVIRVLKRDSFRAYMKAQGKLGGQNKVPRLSNDRKIVSALEDMKVTLP
ncbi:MAG: GH3 auxin-responsive promoter family protein [Saprospiraceae bacterium]|jgi:hypothetical protein